MCGDKMTAIKQLNDFQLPHVNNRKAYAFVKVLFYCRFTQKLPYFRLNKNFFHSLIIALYPRSGKGYGIDSEYFYTIEHFPLSEGKSNVGTFTQVQV